MKNNKQIKRWLLLLPSLFLVGGITLFSIFSTLRESLGIIPGLGMAEPTLESYRILFTQTNFWENLLYSFLVSFGSATLSLLLGVYLSYQLRRTRGGLWELFYKAPLLLSYVASAILIGLTFGNQGIVPRFLTLIGVEVQWDPVYHPLGLGVLLLYVFKGLPFVLFSVLPIVRNGERLYGEVAHNLGASPWNYFWKVLFPLTKRSVLTSFLILFNFMFFTFEGFYFLGPSHPTSLGVMAYECYTQTDLTLRTIGMAINMLMIGVSIILCGLYYGMIKKVRDFNEGGNHS